MPTQPPFTLATDALTTLDAVKSYVAQDDLDPSQNDRLTWLINAASKAVMAYCQREFKTTTTPGTVRIFRMRGDGYISFGRWDLQTATLVQIDTESGATPTTIPADQYALLPIESPDGVYGSLRFYSFAVGQVVRQVYRLPRQVSITGTWGWPSVPADVENATIITATKWWKRDNATRGFNPDEALPLSDGLNVPFDARMILAPYKRVLI